MATVFDGELSGHLIFRGYEDGKYIHKNQLNSLINYLAGNINAIWNPNRGYYYDWYNESANLQIVVRWRKNHDLQLKGKYGERICYTLDSENGELIDLTNIKYRDHHKTCWKCNRLDAIKLR